MPQVPHHLYRQMSPPQLSSRSPRSVQHIIHEARKNLHGDVFECQGRPVKQLQKPAAENGATVVVAEIADGVFQKETRAILYQIENPRPA